MTKLEDPKAARDAAYATANAACAAARLLMLIGMLLMMLS